MPPADAFSRYHAELLEGDYDCVDRLVLNAFFPLGQSAQGYSEQYGAQIRLGSGQTDCV